MARWAGGAVLVLVAALVVCVLMIHPWSGKTNKSSAQARDQFAADRTDVSPAEFDADRAMRYLEKLCKIGPRISGTEGMKKQQELLEKHFRDLGAEVSRQNFSVRQKSVRVETKMTNLIVSWYPSRKRRVILCSHYDTRPQADQEHDTRRWREPFVSANDGGSGVALLMELAHHMKDLKIEVGVDFVFFDGEEFVYDPEDRYFFGSRHFADTYSRSDGKKFYGGAILFDMVGGKKAHFPVEQNSFRMAPNLVQAIWGIAEELGYSSFDAKEFCSKGPVQDDHLPLNRAGIPAVDIIDFDYPHWHRLTDTPENCSGESLAEVAKVASVWIQRVR